MKKIELYIENELVDLDDNVDILINKQLNDIFDPAKIKNDWTKTVSLPNTPNNNKLFGNIFSPNRIIQYGDTNIGVNFNASKKAYFKLFINSQLLYRGYIKLLNINYTNKNKWRYEIILYGNLGDFFSKFGDSTIKDLLSNNTSYTDNYIHYSGVFPKYNGANYTLLNLWNARKSGVTSRYDLSLDDLYNNDYQINKLFEGNYRNVYLDLCDAENGLYNDGKKFFCGNSAQPSFETSYTEQQVCLKNEIQQKLGFYNDKLIVDLVKELGYTINNIGGEWMNKNNPYWYNTLTTATTPKVFVEDYTVNITGYESTLYTYTGGIFDHNVYIKKPSTISSTTDSVFLTSNYAPTINLNGYTFTTSPTTVTQMDDDIYPTTMNVSYTEYTNIFPKFYATGVATLFGNFYYPIHNSSYSVWIAITAYWMNNDSGDTQNLYTTKRIYLTSSDFEDNEQNFYYFRIVAAPPNLIQVRLKDSNKWVNLEDVFGNSLSTQMSKFSNTNIQNIGLMYDIQVLNRSNATLLNDTVPFPIQVTMNNVNILMNEVQWKMNLTSVKEVNSLSKVRYADYLPNMKASDFFINYIKMFGLYLDIDDDNKSISILTRNEYYNNHNILDWENKFDYSSKSEMIPLNFSTKYIRLGYTESDTNTTKIYKTKYNKSYGEQILNTGYGFNDDTYNIFDKNVYANYAVASQDYDIYSFNNNPKVIPHWFNEELPKSKPNDKTFIVFANQNYNTIDDIDKMYKIPYQYGSGESDVTNMYFGFYNQGIYPLTFSEFNVDGYNLYHCILTNDILGYISLVPFSQIQQNYSCFGPLAVTGQTDDYYIETTSYYPNAQDIQYSLDFGIPMEQYHNYNYPTGTTIYDRLFKKYLEDRYNVNTKIFKGSFYLTDLDIANLKFSNFIYLFGMYWTINKINDFDVLNTKLTEVELVSVNDINNYTNGQNLQ